MPDLPLPARPDLAADRLTGAVFCGGRSSRFGSDKALADVGGVPMGYHVVVALRDAGVDPVAAIGGSAGVELAVPTVPDRFPGEGPLAALVTALLWADRGHVVAVPCDLPLLRAEHVRAIVAAARPGVASVATLDGRPQPSIGCWPAGWGRRLLEALGGGARAWRAALDVGPWVGVELPSEALADADTPETLRNLVEPGRAPTAGPTGGPEI